MPEQPTSPPPPPPDGGSTGAAADVGIRLGARIIDGIIVGLVSALVVTPIVFSLLFSDAASGGMMGAFGGGGFTVAGIVFSLLALAINLAYFALFDSNMGGTPGKKLLSLEVRGASGSNPTVGESLQRNAWLALSVVPTILGSLLQLAAAIYIAVTISSSDRNLGWHDKFAGTSVMRN